MSGHGTTSTFRWQSVLDRRGWGFMFDPEDHYPDLLIPLLGRTG